MLRFLAILALTALMVPGAALGSRAVHAGDIAPAADNAAGGGASGDLIYALRSGRTGIPDNLVIPKDALRVDNTTYSGRFALQYVTEVLEARVSSVAELAQKVDDLAVDLTAVDAALRDMPGLANDPVVLQAVAKLKSRILPDLFYVEVIRKNTNPTVDDIAATLPDPPPQYDVRVVINADEAKIDEARKAIAAGEDFGDVARKYSDGLAAEKGGVVGTITEGKFGTFSEEEFRTIRNLKEGENSIPFLGRLGWMIVRMDRIRTPAMQKRETAERDFETFRLNAEKTAYEKRIAEIRDRAKIEWNEPGLARINAALDNNLPLTDELRQTVLFTIDGSPVYAFDLDTLWNFHSKPTIDIYLDKRVRMELVSREADRLGYTSRIAGLVDVARRRAIVREYFRRKSAGFVPTEKDFREYYDGHKDRFAIEETRRLLVIETADRKKAAEVVRKAKKGEDFGTLAETYNDSEENRKRKGDIMNFLPRAKIHPDVARDAFSAREGQVFGPYELTAEGGKKVYAVVKVAEIRKASFRPFESIGRGVIGDRILAGRMEDFYKRFFENVQKEHTVEILIREKGEKGP